MARSSPFNEVNFTSVVARPCPAAWQSSASFSWPVGFLRCDWWSIYELEKEHGYLLHQSFLVFAICITVALHCCSSANMRRIKACRGLSWSSLYGLNLRWYYCILDFILEYMQLRSSTIRLGSSKALDPIRDCKYFLFRENIASLYLEGSM